MKFLAIIASLTFTAWAAYWQGHRVGLRASPEFAKVQDVHNREIEAFFVEVLDAPTSRDQVCDQILELASDELRAPVDFDQ